MSRQHWAERRDWAAWFASSAFQDEAEAWARESLSRLGFRPLLDSWQVRRTRAWSTQATLKAVDPDGVPCTIWFKAGNPGQAFEPRLLLVLADLVPGHFLTPLAVDGDRGWMLTKDFGPTLFDQGVSDEDGGAASQLVARLGEAQLAAVDHRDPLLATGLDEITPTLLERAVSAMMADATALPEDHPGHLPGAEVARTRDGVAAAAELLQQLAGGLVPFTLDHNDLHTNNAYGSPSAPRLFDLGDALWGHPFVGFAWLTELGPARLAAATARFEQYGSGEELARELEMALRLQPVHRLLAWWRVLAPVTPDAWPEHAASIPHWCRRLGELAD